MQRVVAQILWRSNISFMDKLSDENSRIWYARKTIENGWSKTILDMQIQSGLYQNVVNDILRHPSDNPTIGLLLVKGKNQMVKALPEELKSSLPSIEEIEKELE